MLSLKHTVIKQSAVAHTHRERVYICSFTSCVSLSLSEGEIGRDKRTKLWSNMTDCKIVLLYKDRAEVFPPACLGSDTDTRSALLSPKTHSEAEAQTVTKTRAANSTGIKRKKNKKKTHILSSVSLLPDSLLCIF